MYQGKNSQGDQMWRTLSDNNLAMDLAILDRVDVSIGNQSDEEGDAKASAYRNVWMIRCLDTKEIMISRRRIRSRGSDQKMSKLNRLRGAPDGAPDQIWIGLEPAHIWKDVWAGKKIYKD